MLIEYTFDRPELSFDGHCLSLEHCGKRLIFANISDFSIEGSRVSFSGDYVPQRYDIISFKLKDNPNENLGRFIEFTHDRTGIKVDFSFDKQVQFPHIEPICYSDVEIVTFTRISDNVTYRNVWKSMDYTYDEKTGIIRKDLWTPEEGDTYWFICDTLDLMAATYNSKCDSCRDHINILIVLKLN